MMTLAWVEDAEDMLFSRSQCENVFKETYLSVYNGQFLLCTITIWHSIVLLQSALKR